MGRVVRFSEFDSYYKNLVEEIGVVEGAILDANVIITLSYSPKKFNTRLSDFIINKIEKNNIERYTTVNTTQEYLEFYRRLLLTEALRTIVHSSSGVKLSNKKRGVIKAQSSILANREKSNGADPVFYDREIKKIREVFCRSGRFGYNYWKGICDTYLKKQLKKEYENLEKYKVKYISGYDKEMQRFFHRKILWEDAIEICGEVGAGFSDSMIINALQATSFPFAISFDSDLAFTVIADDSLKDIVMPDELIDNNDSLLKLLKE